MPRPQSSDVFMKIAEVVGTRGTCPRRHVGAVLVRDNRVIATGYNGSIPGAAHCDDVGCLMVNNHCKRTIHAELNVIIQCALEGISTRGAILYVTTAPCGECWKLFRAAKVAQVYYLDGDYIPEFVMEDDGAYAPKLTRFNYSEDVQC